jgi:hypothetical protein
MGVKTRHIRTTDTADKLHLSKNFGCIFLWRERSITILQIMGRDQNVFGNFDKFCIITALLTYYASRWFPRGYVDFLHRLTESNLQSVIKYGLQPSARMAKGNAAATSQKSYRIKKAGLFSQRCFFIGFDPGHNR